MCKAKCLLTVLGVLVLVTVLTGCGGMDGATGPGVDAAAKPVKPPPPPPPPPPMPTGQRIAFLRDNAIWTMNTDGSDQVAVGSGMHADWHRALAKMAVVRNYCIYTMEGNGTNAVPVTTQVSYGGAASYDQYPDWSPDGTKIAFTRGMVSDGIGSSIQILDLGSGNITQIYPDPAVDPREYTVPIYSPKWSPDGNFLVFYRGNGWALGVVNLVTG
ncbi:MAG: hypothetical protein HPY69_19930 [Armatimonadetes bacterium]|nr:hypothetical protein [Armatimonadota bacterium]